jgi:uncharacterized membrane protein YfcA
MGLEAWLVRLAMGAGLGFCIGLTGIGGGVVLMSILTLLLGLPASVAVGTASLYNFLTKAFGAFEHFKLKNVDISLSRWLLVGAVPANLVSAWMVTGLAQRLDVASGALAQFQRDLKTVVAAAVLVSVVMLIINFTHHGRRPEDVPPTALAERLRKRVRLRRAVAVVLGAVIGALMGATAVGGGVILMPVLIMVFGLCASRTVGTSIFVSTVLTMITAILYGRGTQMDWQTAVLMAAGSMVGVYWGSKLCVKMPERALRLLVIVIVIFAAVCMLW